MRRFLITFMVASHSKGKACKQEVWICNNKKAGVAVFAILKNKWAGFEPVSCIELR